MNDRSSRKPLEEQEKVTLINFFNYGSGKFVNNVNEVAAERLLTVSEGN